MKTTTIPLGELIKPAKTQRAGNEVLPILSMTMRDGLVDQDTKFKKRVASADTSEYKIVFRDQLVVGFPIDEGVLSVQRRYDRAIISPAYAIWDLMVEHDLDPDYLERFLRSPRALAFYTAKLRGTTARRRTLPDEVFLAMPVTVPSLAEQRRMVGVLDRAEALRGKRREALARLDEFTQSLFLGMFGDPVLNPYAFPLVSLKSVGNVDRGVSKHRPRNASELLGGPYPLIQTGEIASCGGYIRDFRSTYSEAGLRQSKLWSAGTLCITIAANIAKTGILTFDACFPDSVVGFRADDPATVEFVRVWLSFLQKTLEDNAPEFAQKNINLAILRSLKVPLPPLTLQQEFARRVEAVERVKAGQRGHLGELDGLFSSLQDRAFGGRL